MPLRLWHIAMRAPIESQWFAVDIAIRSIQKFIFTSHIRSQTCSTVFILKSCATSKNIFDGRATAAAATYRHIYSGWECQNTIWLWKTIFEIISSGDSGFDTKVISFARSDDGEAQNTHETQSPIYEKKCFICEMEKQFHRLFFISSFFSCRLAHFHAVLNECILVHNHDETVLLIVFVCIICIMRICLLSHTIRIRIRSVIVNAEQ